MRVVSNVSETKANPDYPFAIAFRPSVFRLEIEELAKWRKV